MMSSQDVDVVKAHKKASEAVSKGVLQNTSQHLDQQQQQNDQEQEQEQEDNKMLKFVLITQFYFPNDIKTRQNIQDVLVQNLKNDVIDEIYLISEQEYDFSQLPNSHKITNFLLKSRLHFADAFRLANERLSGRMFILSNSDIYFDQSLQEVIQKKSSPLDPNLVLALSTWSPNDVDGKLSLSLRSDSQDAWIMTSPVSNEIIEQSEFPLGVARCDNRLAKLLIDAGYK